MPLLKVNIHISHWAMFLPWTTVLYWPFAQSFDNKELRTMHSMIHRYRRCTRDVTERTNDSERFFLANWCKLNQGKESWNWCISDSDMLLYTRLRNGLWTVLRLRSKRWHTASQRMDSVVTSNVFSAVFRAQLKPLLSSYRLNQVSVLSKEHNACEPSQGSPCPAIPFHRPGREPCRSLKSSPCSPPFVCFGSHFGLFTFF